jgi:lipoic acid synthetase
MMVGLGETKKEVVNTMEEVAKIGVDIFTIGQYLQPTKNHLPVDRYVGPEEFEIYHKKGVALGFKIMESGPLVRSSYHADKQARVSIDIGKP